MDLSNILLSAGLFLVGLLVTVMRQISAKTGDISINLATIARQVIDHERRIGKLEDK